jgi:hypothetical protein
MAHTGAWMLGDKAHVQINRGLGRPGAYTDAVEAFMRSLGVP